MMDDSAGPGLAQRDRSSRGGTGSDERAVGRRGTVLYAVFEVPQALSEWFDGPAGIVGGLCSGGVSVGRNRRWAGGVGGEPRAVDPGHRARCVGAGPASQSPGAAVGTPSGWSPRTGRLTFPEHRTQETTQTDSPGARRSSTIWNPMQPTCRCGSASRLTAWSPARPAASCSERPAASAPRTRSSSARARTSPHRPLFGGGVPTRPGRPRRRGIPEPGGSAALPGPCRWHRPVRVPDRGGAVPVRA
jgi:hypothetical protein